MKTWKRYSLGLTAIAGLTPALMAQPPAPPAAPAAAASAAPGFNLWAMFQCPPDKKAKCKEKCCSMPLVQAMMSGLKPMMGMAGLGEPCCCPPVPGAPGAKPTADQANAPGAGGAAAKIQKDEAEAKARRIAVRYLGTVDCHWWPEAEAQLIGALRADRNECVRMEAAMAFGRGCCCNKRTIEALTICVEGSEKDGNPSENSERVKAAAFFALQGCLARVEASPTPKAPEPAPKPPEPPTAAKIGGPIQLTSYYEKSNSKSLAQVVQEARRVLDAQGNGVPTAAPLNTGERSVSGILRYAITTHPSPQEVVANNGPLVYDGTTYGPKPTLATRLAAMSVSGPASQPAVRSSAVMQVEGQRDSMPINVMRRSGDSVLFSEPPTPTAAREPSRRTSRAMTRYSEPAPAPSPMAVRENQPTGLLPKLMRRSPEFSQPPAEGVTGAVIIREPAEYVQPASMPSAEPAPIPVPVITREAPRDGLLPRLFGR